MQFHKMLILATGFALSLAASAQWQWVDKDGNKVFSDRAPPQEIPEKSILKRPGGARATTPAPSVPAASSTGVTPKLPQVSGTDPALEEKKKQAEDAEAAKKKAEADKLAQAKAENCTRAKQAKANFDSGLRIARTNDKGEREILDDSARASETKRLQDIITSDCR